MSNDAVSQLETTFDGLMVRLLDLTGGLVAHLNELGTDTTTRSEPEQAKFNQCMNKVRADDAKVKGCMRGLYAVFVDALGHYTDLRKEKDRVTDLLDQHRVELEEVKQRQEVCDKEVAETLKQVRALPHDAQYSAQLDALLDSLQTQMDDNAGWQKRVLRLSEVISSLQDEIVSMRVIETDLMFRNDALKAELCGRIQQVQMMERGMSNPSDPRFKMYSRILCEIEQNSMKAYSQHARKMSELGRAAIVRSDSSSSVDSKLPEQGEAKIYRRTVTIQKLQDGYGITIAGGDKTDGVQNPAIVQQIRPGGSADQSGSIFKKDVIISINGKALSSFVEHSEIVQVIKGSTEVTFELQSRVPLDPPSTSPKKQTQQQQKGLMRADDVVPAAAGENEEPVFAVDDRVNVRGYTCGGTVRFVGQHHDPTKGMRVMVELDDAMGRNNGTIDGHVYCQLKPKHGIFVRLMKVSLATDGSHAVDASSMDRQVDVLDVLAAPAQNYSQSTAPDDSNAEASATLPNTTDASEPEHSVPYPPWMGKKIADSNNKS